MTKLRRHSGFTLVEVTLAIAFLSILLIAILTVTVAAGKLYIKGDTNKTINHHQTKIETTMRRRRMMNIDWNIVTFLWSKGNNTEH